MHITMYLLLFLAFILANFPFLTQRGLGFLPLKRKTIVHHLAELALGALLISVLGYVLEKRTTGAVHAQSWEFYVVALCLYLVFAFPAFVWRYFWHARHQI